MKVIFTLLLFSIYLYSTSVTIPPGSSAKWVAQHLKDRDILSSAHMFYVYLRANQLTTKLHSGQFDIPPNVSYKQLADILTGKTQQLFRLTIPEGYTIQEIADELEAQQIISNAKQFLNYIKTKKTTAINSYLSKQTLPSFEGLFFPDTYYFSRHSSFDTVYKTFIKRFNDVFVSEYKKVKQPTLTFYQTLILASIIEKEAGTVHEMPIISGVFHNRLRKKMFLASCPTVGYAMGNPRKKSLTYKDLKYKSPYNTYNNKGLPPSPIASPGKKAFQAALFPAKTPYLYFVSKNDTTGTHVFSLTLNEHLKNQQKILSKSR